MIQLKEKWDGYYSICAETATCLYVYHDHTIIEIEKNNFSHRVLLSNIDTYYFGALELNGGVVLNYNNMLTYVARDGGITELGLDLSAQCVAGNDIVAYKSRQPRSLQRISLTGKEVWKTAIELDINRKHLVRDGRSYFKWKSVLYKLTLATGEVQELIDFNEHYGEVTSYEVLAFYNDTVICQCKGNMMGIDPHNGSVKYTVEEWTDREGNKQKWPFTFASLPGIYEDKIYALGNDHLGCYDLQHHTCRYWKTNTQAPDGVPVNVEHGTLYGDKIYYTGKNPTSHWSRECNRFGVFDLNKEEIVWQTVLPLHEETMLNREPVVSDNYIYVNDSDHKLYIFERL